MAGFPVWVSCTSAPQAEELISLEQENDAEVIRAVLAGEVERYAVLVRRYRPRYASYAARVAGSIDSGEDAMQEAFIRAYDRLAQCRDPQNFRGWFFLILRNCCFAEARARRRLDGLDDATDRPELQTEEQSSAALEGEEQRRELDRAMARLTPIQREVFAMKHVEGLTYEQMAERLQTTVGSLKMRMHRAYDRLREELKGYL
ncbi:MAG TPA: RNA polymerase sigma factor [Gemmatimonadales bacterium]|nr:RNA polymerase sigma factor [Gemmatimonadales bacterium]